MYEPALQEKRFWGPRLEDPAYNAHITHVPLSIGEALVVKQPEIHRTDANEIASEQWRLGIGFKLMKKGTMKYYFEKAPLNTDPNYQLLRDDPWLPMYDIGSQLWSPFNATLLHDYW